MEEVTPGVLRSFLQRLSERYDSPGVFYVLGGSALSFLGNPRVTQDIDYTLEADVKNLERLQVIVTELAAEMHLDLEAVSLAEFIPLPPHSQERHQLIGRYGLLDVYVFDPYSIALSKIARGFEADLEDVLFLLRSGLIEWTQLERHFLVILPEVTGADIDPDEFRSYFEELRRRMT